MDKAVAAAKAAFARGSEWRKMDASVRGKIINKVRYAHIIYIPIYALTLI